MLKTLREKCPHSELLWSKYGRIWIRITPDRDNFYKVKLPCVLRRVNDSKIRRIQNAKLSGYSFYMNTVN